MHVRTAIHRHSGDHFPRDRSWLCIRVTIPLRLNVLPRPNKNCNYCPSAWYIFYEANNEQNIECGSTIN